MSFLDTPIKKEYRTNIDDVVQEFYIPLLKDSVLYRRSVGYFSSTSLLALSRGITGLLNNNGFMEIVASPELSQRDIKDIEQGYEIREIMFNKLTKSLYTLSSEHDIEKLSILSYLISINRLDIKIAFVNKYGIYHEKVGILQDYDGNTVAFSGSMNETLSAYSNNYESFDVFKSWSDDNDRVQLKIAAFEEVWNNNAPNIQVYNFTKELSDILKKYKISTNVHFMLSENTLDPMHPKTPKELKLRDYQIEAIQHWFNADSKGILSMATGTGKTLTALGAVTELFNKLDNRLAIIIICPYQHLVEQWAKDVKWFNMIPILGYSTSSQKKWKVFLRNKVKSFINGVDDHFCFITTNATFISENVQRLLKEIPDNIVIVGDEAHNLGAKNISKALLENIPYRLGLSATIERHYDDEGTQKLYDYFGDVCYEYTLSDAIENDMLVDYYYYPIAVSLTEDEFHKYKELSKTITRLSHYDNNNSKEIVKRLLIKRSRIIAGAENKLIELRNLMKEHRNDTHTLIYCGTTKNAINISEDDSIEMRQLDQVAEILGNELEMRISKFTSDESVEEREIIKKNFSDGNINALVAIRCLDEGVDIPAIKTAFLLASSTNPKEYIQRRGRVLRKYPGKSYANIFDFITLPYSIEEADRVYNNSNLAYNLAQREIKRVSEFAETAINSADAYLLINKIKIAFKPMILEE